jgi:hypothetical protein
MPSTDISNFDPDQAAQAAGMFVAVGTDRATGRAVIALVGAAVTALLDLIDHVDLHDLSQNPGNFGTSQQDADDVCAVGYAVRTPLLKMQGYLS